MKIAIIGDGYIGQAFSSLGDVIDRETISFLTDDDTIKFYAFIQKYDVIINTYEYKHPFYRKETRTLYKTLWHENAEFVNRLSAECDLCGKKFVQISTADLYGNYFKWDKDVETSTALDVGTDYRFTKLAAEKFCHPKDLIIRIRNAFDANPHPDNAIIKGYMADRMYAWADTWSYLPDVVKAVKVLLEQDKSGIYNIVNFEASSLFYCLKTAIGIPFFKSIDPIKEDMENFLMKEFDNVRTHNDTNGSKIKELYQMMPLDAAMILSWQGIENHYNTNFNEEKFLQTLKGSV